MDAGTLIFSSSALSKSSLYTWKFSVMYYRSLAWRTLSITLLACEMSTIVQQFEHSLALPFVGTGMKTDLFQSYCHWWVFQLLAYWVQHFNSIIWEAMKCVKILPKFVPFWWACFIRLLFIAFTYNKKGSTFRLICLDCKDSVAYQNNFICLCWLSVLHNLSKS